MIMRGMFGLLQNDKKFVTDSFMSPNLPAVITELTTDWWVTPPSPTVPPTNGTENFSQISSHCNIKWKISS